MIIGGGISGISASLSAAREGTTVCLVESNNDLGGSIGENSQMPLDYASSCNDPFFRESGIFEEIITTNLRLGNKEGTFTGQARALLNLVKTEPNITTMLGCQCLEVTLILLKDRIDSCTIINHFNSCNFLHRAQYFVDCSNGGEFSKLANARENIISKDRAKAKTVHEFVQI